MFKIIFSLVFIFIAATALPQWTNNTAVNTAVCNASGDQATPKIASTSDGGCYIMWFDNRVPNYKVYLQRLDNAGNPQFGANGLLISAYAQNSSLQDFNIDVDASDNAVLVFTDLRNGAQLNPIAYLIAKDGTSLWPNGVSLTDSTNLSQNIPVVAATSDGNYVFAWNISNIGTTIPNRIAIQKLNAAGVPQWTAPYIKIRGTNAEHSTQMRLVKSDNGSVIMTWDNYTGTNITTTATIKIFAQKFSPSGTNLWSSPQDTIQNLGRVAGISFIQSIVSDKQNGIISFWVDDRDANSRQSVWVQHVNSAGVIQFPKNGSEGSTLSTNNHFTPSAAFMPSTGETYMFWTETNGGQTLVGGLYGQKFDAAGTRQWGANGIEFKALDNNQLSFISAYTLDTSVVVSYTESIFGSGDAVVKAMRTGPSSAFHWPGNIVTASSSSGSKIRKQAVLDPNNGQSVMVWSNGDIMAQNLKLNGEAGVCLLNATVGIEGFWDGATQVQDTMRMYLRKNFSPYDVVDSAKVYLSSSGNAIANYLLAPAGNYYVQLIHRNALETWSASNVSISKSSVAFYDFTTTQSQTYGNNSVLKSGQYCNYSGEIIKDGTIDAADVLDVYNGVIVLASGYVNNDVNGDNFVDVTDLLITYNNATAVVTVMRP